jgi:hypothetical protein
MTGFTEQDLEELIAPRTEACVSIYMGTERASGDPRQNPIKLKNLLSQASDQLLERGLRRPEADALLAPGAALLDDSLFWQRQADGLALFLSDGYFREVQQPIAFEDFVSVAHRFHVKPLLPLLSGDGRFYLLALSQGAVRILSGTRDTVRMLDADGVPASLDEALGTDELGRSSPYHQVAGGPHGGQSVFHGFAGDEQDNKELILRYFRQVDQGLAGILAGKRVPLVLAGVEYLHPIYREANTYPSLLDDGVRGNVDDWSPQALHEAAWKIVGPHFTAAEDAAAGRYHALLGTGKATDSLESALAAASEGRVDVLFVDVAAHRWGVFVPETGSFREESESGGAMDLIDQVAVRTLRNGGTVYAVNRERVPGGGDLAAVFRY